MSADLPHGADPPPAPTAGEAHPPPAGDPMPDAVAAYFRCLNAEDWPTMRGLWTQDAHLRPVGARPRRGPEEIAAFYATLFTPWQQHLDAPTRVIDAGHVVTVEVRFTGRTTGGADATFDAVDVFDLRDGRIAALSTWYDLVLARKLVSR